MFAMRPRKPSVLGALLGLLIGVSPFAALFVFLSYGMTWVPYSDDPCLDDTVRANRQIIDAVQRQDGAAMAAAYDRGVRGLTACLRDPNRVGDHRKRYAASLVEARNAAAQWHAFASGGGAWRDSPGRTPQIAEY